MDLKSCASLKITVFLCEWTRRARTDAEMNARKAARERSNKVLPPNRAERRGRPRKEEIKQQDDMATEGKVKEEVYKKEGIGFLMG